MGLTTVLSISKGLGFARRTLDWATSIVPLRPRQENASAISTVERPEPNAEAYKRHNLCLLAEFQHLLVEEKRYYMAELSRIDIVCIGIGDLSTLTRAKLEAASANNTDITFMRRGLVTHRGAG